MAPPLTVASPPESPSTYEQENVHDVYNQIASHFSATRYKPWPTIRAFLQSIPPGSLGLDAGCGNGKYIPSLDIQGSLMIGLDRSTNLVALARKVGFSSDDGREGGGEVLVVHHVEKKGGREVLVGDVLDLGGVREGSMDFAISIATLHHLSTPARRLSTVRTFLRTLAPTHGRGMIHVWALEQGEGARRVVPDEGRAQDVFVPWVLTPAQPKKKEKKPQKEKIKGDPRLRAPEPVAVVEEPKVEEAKAVEVVEEPPRVYQRYYHLFKSGELQGLLRTACEEEGWTFLPFEEGKAGGEGAKGRWVEVVQEGWDKDNWFCEVRRGVGRKVTESS